MKYYRNSNIFEKIDTEEKAYWLGFLYADGYVDPERGEIILGLAEKYKEHINKFINFLETNAPYKDKINNQNKLYRFFSTVNFYTILLKTGLICCAKLPFKKVVIF